MEIRPSVAESMRFENSRSFDSLKNETFGYRNWVEQSLPSCVKAGHQGSKVIFMQCLVIDFSLKLVPWSLFSLILRVKKSNMKKLVSFIL